jgi:putative membrane protein
VSGGVLIRHSLLFHLKQESFVTGRLLVLSLIWSHPFPKLLFSRIALVTHTTNGCIYCCVLNKGGFAMISMLLNWVLSAAILLLVANILPGIHVASFSTAMIAIVVMSLVNALVMPLVVLLTLPINVLTLGLFSFVISAMMFGLSAYLLPGFSIDNWLSALVGAALLGLLTSIMQAVNPVKAV